jgi:hypothetical protein
VGFERKLMVWRVTREIDFDRRAFKGICFRGWGLREGEMILMT